jgi:hypothetical protein
MMNEIGNMSDAIESLAYRDVGETIRDAYGDWLKVMRHIQIQPHHHEVPLDAHISHLQTCNETWLKFGKALQAMGARRQERGWTQCWFPRCPEATPNDVGARLTCSGCKVANYCGIYCQKA